MRIYPYAVEELLGILGGRLHTSLNFERSELFVSQIITDSRSSDHVEQAMFVAIKTRKGDGHTYIPQMYARGVRLFLVQDFNESFLQPGAVFIEVADTLRALQIWAAHHRMRFPQTKVVGITGSNGKTIVKEWLSYMLSGRERTLRSPKSYNSQLGVPLSVLPMDDSYSYAVFEAGISKMSEMDALEDIIRPQYGIFTNLGPAHSANFASLEEKAVEKLKLFVHSEKLFYCANHRVVTEVLNSYPGLKNIPVATWSYKERMPGVKLHVSGIERVKDSASSLLSFEYNQLNMQLEVPFSDMVSIEDAMHVVFFMLESGFSLSYIQQRIKSLPAVSMRMEIKEGLCHSQIVNDAYNSDIQSLGLALDFLASRFSSRDTCLILSDILESSQDEVQLYREVADILSTCKLSKIYAIGSALNRQKSLFGNLPIQFYPDTETFLSYMKAEDFKDMSVLLKGARCFAFERIVSRLQDRIHETVLEVNLSSLVHNLNFFRSLIKPHTRLMVMGKAFSYGSGSYEIADILEYNHVDYVTVAYPDEAIALRNAGIHLPIMCMNCEEGGMDGILRYDIEPVIYNFRTLQHLKEAMQRTGCVQGSIGKVKIHIALDTGMHRMGFEEPELEAVFSALESDSRWKVQSVFTHLATADMPDMDEYTLRQLQKYDRMSLRFKEKYPDIIRHCLNTAGIFRYPQYQFDMVRLGIGLYGVGTDSEMQSHLETVSTLKTVISQIRTIDKGEGVGYGRRFVAERKTRVGVIGIGYADGLNRHLGNGKAKVWVKGKLVPIIGSICMDMCMVDLTDTDAVENDEVEIFGRNNPISQISDALETIPYEVLTSVSQRVKRIYIHD